MPAKVATDSVQIEFFDGNLVGLYWPSDADVGDAYPISSELLNRVVRELGFCVGKTAARREPHLLDLREMLDDFTEFADEEEGKNLDELRLVELHRRLHQERRERTLAIVKKGVLLALRADRKKRENKRRDWRERGGNNSRPTRPRGAGESRGGVTPRGGTERRERPRGAGERPRRPPAQSSIRKPASSPGRRVFSPTASTNKAIVEASVSSLAERAQRNEAVAESLRRKQFAHMVQVEIDNARQFREQMRVQMESENRDATAEREARERLARKRKNNDQQRAENERVQHQAFLMEKKMEGERWRLQERKEKEEAERQRRIEQLEQKERRERGLREQQEREEDARREILAVHALQEHSEIVAEETHERMLARKREREHHKRAALGAKSAARVKAAREARQRRLEAAREQYLRKESVTEERLASFSSRRAKEIAKRRKVAKKLERKRKEKVAAKLEAQERRREEILREHEKSEAALEHFRERERVRARERALLSRYEEEEHRLNLQRLRARQRDAADALAAETEEKSRRGEAVRKAQEDLARRCRLMNLETMLLREKLKEELKRSGEDVNVEDFLGSKLYI